VAGLNAQFYGDAGVSLRPAVSMIEEIGKLQIFNCIFLFMLLVDTSGTNCQQSSPH
jgi:hypothetical protein